MSVYKPPPAALCHILAWRYYLMVCRYSGAPNANCYRKSAHERLAGDGGAWDDEIDEERLEHGRRVNEKMKDLKRERPDGYLSWLALDIEYARPWKDIKDWKGAAWARETGTTRRTFRNYRNKGLAWVERNC